jgi:hypothetical protein
MRTKVIIEKVEIGAVYENTAYDFWVTCDLQNHSKIILFDYEPFDLTDYLNKSIEINIKALFVEKGVKENLRHFQGKIIEQSNRFYFTNDFINIQVSKEDIQSEKIEVNTLDVFSFGRLDIESINKFDTESLT